MAAIDNRVAIGADAWERLAPGRSRPVQLHALRALEDGAHLAPSTPGDLLLHVRAEGKDFRHELTRTIMARPGSAVQVVDETQGFRYPSFSTRPEPVEGRALPFSTG